MANAGAAQPVALTKGSKLPSLLLTDPEKRTVDLATLGEQETVVLFWSTRCGFCRSMLGDLRAWELAAPRSAPKLILVSSEEGSEHESLQLRSPILLDRGASVAAKFGANGTPMAIRIDAHGRIASDMAIGAASVLNLLGSADPQEDEDFNVKSAVLANP
jgi:thiol-disulfide isomerase/thioredoxin